MLVFLIIVLTAYSVANLFIYIQTKSVFSIPAIGRTLMAVFCLLVASYPLGRILDNFTGGFLSTLLTKAGSIWLGAMLYLILAFFLVLILRLTNTLLPITHYLGFKNHPYYQQVSVAIVYSLVAIVLILGHINAVNPTVSIIRINAGKTLPNGGIRVVAVSDIHLGTIIGKKQLGKLVKMVNAQHPDIVLLVGDTFDEDVAPVVNGGMGYLFERINSKYGIYAVTGNHEYFGRFEEKINYLKEHKINILRDSAVLIDNFYVIGRDDRQSNYTLKRTRKSVEELTRSLDKSKFLILLDHQPYHLNEAEENGIDLQLSGHTHHGQMWPFNYITNSIFEVSRGYYHKGKTHYYVSTGFGTWGPRVRTGNRPEIVVIDINRTKM